MLRTGGLHGLPGSRHKIRARITACLEQTPRPGLSWLPSTHFPSLSHRQTRRPRESTQQHRNAARCHTARSSPCGCHPGPRSPTSAQKQQQSNSERHLLSSQRYLKPRSGLLPVPGYGLVFRSEHKPPGTTQRRKKNTALSGGDALTEVSQIKGREDRTSHSLQTWRVLGRSPQDVSSAWPWEVSITSPSTGKDSRTRSPRLTCPGHHSVEAALESPLLPRLMLFVLLKSFSVDVPRCVHSLVIAK